VEGMPSLKSSSSSTRGGPKVAVQVMFRLMSTQILGEVPEQSPDHRIKLEPGSGVAVSRIMISL